MVEDENHFLFQCHFYHSLRNQFFQKEKDLYSEFDVMNNNLKHKHLMSEMLVKDTSEYIYYISHVNKNYLPTYLPTYKRHLTKFQLKNMAETQIWLSMIFHCPEYLVLLNTHIRLTSWFF